jgi:hypothetical protein
VSPRDIGEVHGAPPLAPAAHPEYLYAIAAQLEIPALP